jgi:hypothetical protein
MKYLAPIVFFYLHAPYRFDPKTETVGQGRRCTAAALAGAECWLAQQPGHTIHWENDPEADYTGIPHRGPLYLCVVRVPGVGEECMGSIDLGRPRRDRDPLAHPQTRVAVARLALQLMPR